MTLFIRFDELFVSQLARLVFCAAVRMQLHWLNVLRIPSIQLWECYIVALLKNKTHQEIESSEVSFFY